MGVYKDNPKQDGANGPGPSARNSGKSPFPGVVSGNLSDQMNPRRDRREDYTPNPGGQRGNVTGSGEKQR